MHPLCVRAHLAGVTEVQWYDLYFASLYWSVMTLTSIGYGDIMPHNTVERALSCLCMLASGMMWTYAIGTVATIASTLNPHGLHFTQTMDSLNFFMRDRALPKGMRFTLRTFFENSRMVRQKEEARAYATPTHPSGLIILSPLLATSAHSPLPATSPPYHLCSLSHSFHLNIHLLASPATLYSPPFLTSSHRPVPSPQDQALFAKMSPLLQCTVAMEANKRWIRAVWYLKKVEELPPLNGGNLIMKLSRCIKIRCFITTERMPLGQLYILGRGVVVKNWHFFGIGRVFCEDILLNDDELIDHTQAVAMTYCETHTIGRISLIEHINEFPEAKRLIRKAVRKVSLYRSLLVGLMREQNARRVAEREEQSRKEALAPPSPPSSPANSSTRSPRKKTRKKPYSFGFEKSKAGLKRPLSFCPQSCAQGYEKVEDALSMEQKLDVLINTVSHNKDKKFASIDDSSLPQQFPAVAASAELPQSRGRSPDPAADASRTDTQPPMPSRALLPNPFSSSARSATASGATVAIDAQTLATLLADVADIKVALAGRAQPGRGGLWNDSMAA